MIHQKMASLMGKLKVEKNWNNPHFKSKYVMLDDMLAVLLPMLEDAKLLLLNYVEDRKLVTEVIDYENEWASIKSEFPIAQDDPQKIGSCITYWKRYNLGALFNIITEFDDDGNGVSGANHIDKHGLNLQDYIASIQDENDVEHIKTLYKQATSSGLSLSQEQIDWLKSEARKQTDKLESAKWQNLLPSHLSK